MLAEELPILRRQLGLTQAELAECLGVSASLITSIEVGRRVFSEPLQREVMRVFGGRVFVQNSVQARRLPLQREVFSPAKPPVIGIPTASKNRLDGADVHVQAYPKAGSLNPDPVPCEWRDPGGARCAGTTPPDMLYCTWHMALALIEGWPTRRGSAGGPLHADFVRQHNEASQRGASLHYPAWYWTGR